MGDCLIGNSVLGHLPVQRAAVHIQMSCRFRLASETAQGVLDAPLLASLFRVFGTFLSEKMNQVFLCDFLRIHYDGKPFAHVLQFPDIAGEIEVYQILITVVREMMASAPELSVIVFQEEFRQRDYIPSPFPQRWDVEAQNIQAEVQIAAETALLDLVLYISVRSGDYPDIHGNDGIVTQSDDGVFRKHPQKAALEGEAHLGDLIKEDGASVRKFEKTGLSCPCGSGECTRGVSEEFALKKILGKCGAVDGHEGPVAPAACVVDALGEELLAGACLPHYEYARIDFAVLKNRLSGSFEYYIRNNNDMLIAVSYPATLGASAPKTNNGSFRANGWELQLNWRDKIGKEFEYSVGLSLSDAKTEITKFDGAVAIAAGYNNTVGGSAFIEGKPLNALYVYRTNGIMQTQEDVDAYYPTVNASGTKAPTQGTDSQLRPGCVRKVDLNNDGKITTDDLDYYGDANPHWQFGITLGAKWKGLDFSMFIQGVGSMNLVRTGNLSGPFRSWWMNQNRTYLTETWREDNTGAQFPILSFNGDLVTWNYSDYNDINVMNCWYARAKNISLGYTLPQKLVNRVHLSNLRVYVSADNLFSVNNVADNFDPEIQAATGQGKIDCYSRTVSFGVDLTF